LLPAGEPEAEAALGARRACRARRCVLPRRPARLAGVDRKVLRFARQAGGRRARHAEAGRGDAGGHRGAGHQYEPRRRAHGARGARKEVTMRLAIWSVILAAVAVGVALFAGQSAGYVVIVAPPYRIELSLNMLVLLVVAGYFAFYFLARLIATLAAIPARVRAYREERTRSKLRSSLNDALLAFFQGRYASAEKSAAQALIGDETKGVAAIVAARSAHELGRFSEREQFLAQAKGAAPEVDQARLTTLADMLASQERHDEALAVLNDLSAPDARHLR